MTLVQNSVDAVIGGYRAAWTGASDGNWNTTTQNWKQEGTATPVAFATNDAVVFDDSATGTTTISIPANVTTSSGVQFNNSAKNYTIASGTAGIWYRRRCRDGHRLCNSCQCQHVQRGDDA